MEAKGSVGARIKRIEGTRPLSNGATAVPGLRMYVLVAETAA